MAKRIFIEHTHRMFDFIKKHPWLQKITTLPFFIRYIVGIILIILGVIGILPPIPFGIIFLLIGIVVFFGFAKTRNMVFSSIYRLRLHIIYSKIYMWLRNNK